MRARVSGKDEAQREAARAPDEAAADSREREQASDQRRSVFVSSAWLRAMREIAIVTLGILIAFALNAWWEEHRERRQEQHHLHALASDFRENIDQLARLAPALDSVSQNSLKLLEAARAGRDPQIEEIRALIGEVFSSQRFEPVMGAYEALVNSAGLTLLRDDALRAALANFAASAAGSYSEWYANQVYLDFTRKFIGRLRIADDLYPTSSAAHAYADVLEDPAFQEHLALRYHLERQMAARYRELLRQAEDILQRIERAER